MSIIDLIQGSLETKANNARELAQINRANAVAKPGAFANDPFAGMKAGENRTWGSFNASQVGSPTTGLQVIRGMPSGIGTIQTLMTQGLSPDDASKVAQTGSSLEETSLKSRLLPDETAAKIGLANATAGLTNNRAATERAELDWLPATRRAQLDQMSAATRQTNAATRQTDTQTRGLSIENDYNAKDTSPLSSAFRKFRPPTLDEIVSGQWGR